MKIDIKSRKLVLVPLLAAGIGGIASLTMLRSDAAAQSSSFPAISSQLPPDIPGNATITDAATFAWQEFIALNWPAMPQSGQPGSNTRGVPDNSKKFGEDSSGSNQANQPVVWETYRNKVETFPGVGDPPGYASGASQDYGFDVGPQYVYGERSTDGSVQNNPGGSPLVVPPCQNPTQAAVTTPAYVNLDEITQIGLNSMFAGTVPTSVNNPTAQNANAEPQLIRFLAKGNRTFYDYVAANAYWYQNAGYNLAKNNFFGAAKANSFPPPTPTIQLPNDTILVKAAWRPLASGENAPDFHTKTVRFYDQNGSEKSACYREQVWALIALHIIRKTPNAPTFIFATFEYTSNILTADGKPVEDNTGKEINAPAGDAMDPRLNYYDINKAGTVTYYSPDYPKGIKVPPLPAVTPPLPPLPSGMLPVVQTDGAYCNATQGNNRLYFQDLYSNTNAIPPPHSGVCVNKRYFAIPAPIQQINAAAHAALTNYGAPALWQNYKLINVQFQPFNQEEIDTSGNNTNRLASTFSLANSVVETDNTLQQFFGGLFSFPNPPKDDPTKPVAGLFFKSASQIGKESGKPGDPAYNVFQPPSGSVPANQFKVTNMGGCMGCHGRTQRAGTDFSFTLAGGPVKEPEFAVSTSTAPSAQARGGASDQSIGFDRSRLEALHRALSGE